MSGPLGGTGNGVLPLPSGFRIAVDPSVRLAGPGVVVGGRPERMLRFGARGRSAWSELLAGPVVSAAGGTLARHLTDAGLAHPVPPAEVGTGGVTVIVPVRDRVDELDRCLRALGDRFPVLVVDDASANRRGVAAVARRHGARLVRREVNGGPGAARNTGLALVDTDAVVFLDSDCVPDGDWIGSLAAHLADPQVAAVAPRVVGAPGRTGARRHARARCPLDMGPWPARVAPTSRVRYVPSAALLARREALRSVATTAGPFDEGLRWGEDVDLVWRLERLGWRVRYEPAVQVPHVGPRHWHGALARHHRYGTSAAPLARRHPGALAPLVLEPWTAIAVAATLARRPVPAGAAAVAALGRAATLRRRAGLRGFGGRAVAARAGVTLRMTGTYATRFAVPVLLGSAVRYPAARPAVAALLAVPPLASWWCSRPAPVGPLAYIAGHIAEDVAYGTGVIRGCLSERTLAPLVPAVVSTSLAKVGSGAGSGAQAS